MVKHNRSTRSRGFFAMEAIIGVTLAATIATGVFVISARQQRAAIAAAEARSACRLAENALVRLQSGGKVPDEVKLRPLDTPAAPPGWRWVEATAVVGTHRSVLCGLVPREGGRP